MNFNNKTILLTGATDGIGLKTAENLAEMNVNLILHGKNPEKGEQIKNRLINQSGNKNIHYYNADLSSFSEIEQFINNIRKDFSKLDILINNAGIYENRKILLDNGLEKTFMVNYLSAFVISLQLIDLLKMSENTKIINVSSMVHASNIDFDNLNGEKSYSGEAAYSLSKLCNILFTYKAAKEFAKDKISVNALHPGVINTKLLRSGWGPFGSSTTNGAAQILFVAGLKNEITGKYFENDREVQSAAISYDKSVQQKLWNYSINLANKFFSNKILF